ncbi:MAG: hypothetical protein JXA13_03790 [Anaerolineales bacterium]|nr:hypothetical protein [Anaerolineales bacterium]
MAINQQNESKSLSWPDLYSTREAEIQDTRRAIKFIFPFIIFFVITAVYLVFYNFLILHQQTYQGGAYGPIVFNQLITRVSIRFLILLVLVFVGQFVLYRAARNFLTTLFSPPDSFKSLEKIRTRMIGTYPYSEKFRTSGFPYSFVPIDIREVDKKTFNLQKHYIHWLGGPAILIIYDGTGVYLQRGNIFSRTLGPGIYLLERFETVQEIIDLRTQTITSSDKDTPRPISGRTKDGIKINFNIEISFRIIPAIMETYSDQNANKSPEEKEAEKNFLIKTPVNAGDLHAIRKAVERTSLRSRPEEGYTEAKWRDAVWGTVSGELARYITKHHLDELLTFEDGQAPNAHYVNPGSTPDNKNPTVVQKAGILLSESERERLRAKIDRELQRTTGVTLTNLRIINFKLPPVVEEQRQEMIQADSQSKVIRIEGNITAEKILIREKKRSQTQKELIANIADSLSDVDLTNFTNAIMLALSDSLPQGPDEVMFSSLFAMDTFDTLDYLREFLSGAEPSTAKKPTNPEK